jgi:hypothetical protein
MPFSASHLLHGLAWNQIRIFAKTAWRLADKAKAGEVRTAAMLIYYDRELKITNLCCTQRYDIHIRFIKTHNSIKNDKRAQAQKVF